MSSASRALILSAMLMAPAFGDALAATDQPAPTHESPSASERLQEVTVTAERQKLMPRVRKFVNQIVAPENNGEDGIARWQVPPVCPSSRASLNSTANSFSRASPTSQTSQGCRSPANTAVRISGRARGPHRLGSGVPEIPIWDKPVGDRTVGPDRACHGARNRPLTSTGTVPSGHVPVGPPKFTVSSRYRKRMEASSCRLRSRESCRS